MLTIQILIILDIDFVEYPVSDYVVYEDDMKSTSVYGTSLKHWVISWKTIKQILRAFSTKQADGAPFKPFNWRTLYQNFELLLCSKSLKRFYENLSMIFKNYRRSNGYKDLVFFC